MEPLSQSPNCINFSVWQAEKLMQVAGGEA